MLDLHLHVWPHQPGTPTPTFQQLESYCERATEKGISQIAITEHSHRFDRLISEVIPHWNRPTIGPVADATAHVLQAESGGDLDAYVTALLDAQHAGLPILVGLEVDYLPGAMPAMAEVLAEYPFDILLGSVHWLDDWLFDAYDTAAFAAVWEERQIDDVYAQYVDAVLDMATTGVVDVLAHLDVIKVAGNRSPNQKLHEQRLVDGLADNKIAIEFSSAGLRKPADDTYPGASLLDALVRSGADLTTASDGHTVDQIGLGFDRLGRELDKRGITELVTFDRRNPIVHQR